MPPAQRAASEGNISSQHRKDTARILSTMVPGMGAPLVSLCLNYCFGPEEKKEPRGRRLSSRSSSPSSSSFSASASSAFSAGSSASSSEPSRFKLHRMDSGPMGEHSLLDPLPGRDKYGFTSRAESFTFQLKL